MTIPPDTRPGSPDGPLWDPEAIPAATVIVVRDGSHGLETLLLQRDRKLSFAGGMWVFPGGRIDPADRAAGGASDLEAAARTAAVREAAEEAGIVVRAEDLRRWSHWTPPPETPKRFSTAFFVAPLEDDRSAIVIDDGEIRDHRWERPDVVLELREEGTVALSPPTFISLVQLLPHGDVASVLADADGRGGGFEHFATRFQVVDSDVIAMYHGDAGYEDGDASANGPRHRLRMGPRWTYERDV
ncbi:MAG: NUDIX hydrolase [Microthrixaceae bacterium]